MNKILVGALILVVVSGGVFFFFKSLKQNTIDIDYKNTEYLIEGQKVKLVDGIGKIDSDPKMIVKYFGNDLKTDLNNDGIEDVVFLSTVEMGGTGTFYYVLAALAPGNVYGGKGKYVGSDGYFIGDRISPQNIEVSNKPGQKNVIVVNYADRSIDEPMSTSPSMGRSVSLKLDYENMRWGIVEADFEGESK
jgi:hypothetical protein